MTPRAFIFLSCLLLFACGDDTTGSNVNNDNQNGFAICGNGEVETGEQCDDGDQNSDTRPDACRTSCRAAYCGDNVIDGDEECDRQNLVGTTCQTLGYTKGSLSCSVACSFDASGCSLCGDGEAEGEDPEALGYETCDGSDLRGQDCISIGQASGVLGCDDSCEWDTSGCVGAGAICGNGVVEAGEDCDDGNNNLSDSCPDGPGGTCVTAYCGDGFIWAGMETCDDGNGENGDLCPDGVGGSCQPATCGDGFVHVGVETCDTGLDPYCNADCHGVCGDGTRRPPYEVCDDGNNVDDADCYADCSGYCGDGILQPSREECDPNLDGTDVCDPDCTWTQCGDGHCNLVSEDPWNCAADCSCADFGGIDCNGIKCCFPGGTNQPAICCPDGNCVIYDDWSGDPVENCGSCGNDCQGGNGYRCQSGTCVTPP